MPYRAFISYSRKDTALAVWLHRRLEAFRAPEASGESARPLRPVFRDADELSASTDLSASITAALAESETLVVICSPAAAASAWVNEEIKRFIAGRADARVFLALAEGEPQRAGGNAAFPPALSSIAREPLWVDFRPGGEGRARALARLIAGLTNVGFDDVWKRQVRAARLRLAAGSATALVLAIAIGYAAFQTLRPVEIADCPLDRLVFRDAWTDAEFAVERVGERRFFLCESGVVAAPSGVPEGECRGPFGETVLEGAYSEVGENGRQPPRRLYMTYYRSDGAPCCWWEGAVAPPDYSDPVPPEAPFSWIARGQAPKLGQYGLAEIAFDPQTDDPDLPINPLTAMRCAAPRL